MDLYFFLRRLVRNISEKKYFAQGVFIGLFTPPIVFLMLGESNAALISFFFSLATVLIISYTPEIQKHEDLVRYLKSFFTRR